MGKQIASIMGSPAPKPDKDLKKLQQQQLASQASRQASQDAELASARRARLSGGSQRSGLFYQGPAQATGQATTLGGT